MHRREKILILAFIAVVLIWRGWPLAQRVLFGSLEQRKGQLHLLESQLSEKQAEQDSMLRALGRMKAWREASLPPQPLNAQRLYQQWLTDLTQMAGMNRPAIKPTTRVTTQGDVYSAVQIEIEGRATFQQLVRFLYHFYRANLLQRIVQINITRPTDQQSPSMQVKLVAEGLALREAADRATLFPETRLAQDVSASATALQVTQAKGFPTPPFRIRLGHEYATVTGVSDSQWTVTRGVDATAAASHRAGDEVELELVNPAFAELTFEKLSESLAGALFRRYENQPPTVARVGSQTAYYGRELRFTVRAQDPDQPPNELAYSLGQDAPRGATIDRATGEVRWTPESSLRAGEYPFRIFVRDNGTPPQTATQTVPVRLREDPAQHTMLIASIDQDGQPQAWLYDQTSHQRMILQAGTSFQVGDLSARVLEIGPDYMIFQTQDTAYRVELGQTLRQMRQTEQVPVVAVPSDTPPVTAPQEEPRVEG